MRRRFLVLAGALAVIGILAFLLWRHAHRPPPRATPLFTAAPATVTVIAGRWASGERIALRRGAHGWRLAAPVDAPANATRVDAFLAALAEPVAHRYTPAAVPLTRAGLAPPRLRLRVGTEVATFGRRNPATGLRYVRRGRSVFMVADTLLPRLAAGPWQFVSTRPVPPGDSVRAVQRDGAKPVDTPRLLAAWRHARADSVGPESQSARSRPLARIRLHLAHRPQPLEFDVLARRPRLRLRRAGSTLVYTFPAAAASRLIPAPGHA